MMSCASDYRFLHSVPVDVRCSSKIAPHFFHTSWYHASVDVAGNHISGILIIKTMPDSSRRIVFTNEAGVTFFDFGFSPAGEFKVHAILKKLDRKPVKRTLRKDFELILGVPFQSGHFQSWTSGEEVYFGITRQKGTDYFITGKDCRALLRLEMGSPRKRKVSVIFTGSGYPSPEKIDLTHHTFNMQIVLTRFKKE